MNPTMLKYWMPAAIALCTFIILPAFCQKPARLKNIDTGTNASFRGLSVVDDSVAWVSGNNGWVGRTINGGRDWTFAQVKDFEQYDFRSLYAFDAQTAVIINAGSPAHILHTRDGGRHWNLVYTNEHPDVFVDGVDFWNGREGILYGDPIDGHMLLLATHDGGLSWQELPESRRPALAAGEASFAASGTGIRCMGAEKLVIATGGMVSRLWISPDKGRHWHTRQPPVLQGRNTTGIFSVAFADDKTGLVVGGDYKADTLATDHVFCTTNGGKSWTAPAVPTRGYRECVEYISRTTVLAAGPRGTDISHDGGMHWKPFSDEPSFHAVRKARNGSLLVMAGGEGKISVWRVDGQ